MAGWDDVRRTALSLPESSEREVRGARRWTVRDKLFVWERPLRERELADLGWSEQPGAVLAARVQDESVKRALTRSDPAVFFTTPHFDGYAAVLIHLQQIDREELHELIVEAWIARASRACA